MITFEDQLIVGLADTDTEPLRLGVGPRRGCREIRAIIRALKPCTVSRMKLLLHMDSIQVTPVEFL